MKGATLYSVCLRLGVVVSIHAPVKGATTACGPCRTWERGFNPRTREGCDDVVDGDLGGVILVSIHAPVKGATLGHGDGLAALGGVSIHAPVKGATGPSPSSSTLDARFNPRTREGCDV